MTRQPLHLMKHLPLLAICAASVAGVGACVIPIGGAEVGDLRVTWSFDGRQRCAEAGVENVTIQLIEEGKEGEGALAFGQTAECIAGSMVIPDVVAGRYTMTAVGEGEVAIYNNGKGVVVDVVANDESAVEAPLALVNGQVVATIVYPYTFDGVASCTVAGVATLRAEIYTEDGVFLVSETSDCATGVGTVTNIPLSAKLLRVFGLDNNNNVLFQSDSSDEPGAQDVVLDQLQGGQTFRVNSVPLVAALATAEIRYTFGGVEFCGLAGVANVSAQLRDSEGRVVTGGGQTVPCVQGNVVFVNIPVGTYDLHIEGTDGNDVVQFSRDVEDLVIDSQRFELAVDLVALSSQVIVRFVLPENESCASLGIATIDVRVIDEDGAPLGVAAACIAGEAVLTGPAPGNATIVAEGVVGADVIISGTDEVVLRPGRNVIALVLEPVRSILDISWQFQTEVRNDVLEALETDRNPLVRVSSSCRDADVDNVLVSVSRGTVLLEAVVTACDAGRVEIPALPIGGNVTVTIEGLREQEGDSIFEVTDTFALAGPRTVRSAILTPSIVFARVVWAGDCGAAGAATVDVQIRANGVTEAGINVPCAQGTVLIALPRGTEGANVSVNLRGVSGQGAPIGATELVQANNPRVTPGINTFRFIGPAI